MSKETISFRIPATKRAAVDELAAALDRDRSAIINEAIDAYLELHHWQVDHISRALAEADSGVEGVAHEDVFKRVRSRIDARLKHAG
jgi:predicted transcriptional regulator